MDLNLREMLIGNPIRLRYVFRFSTSRVQHPESVAEHSFYVAFYCLMIGRWVNGRAPLEMPALVNIEKLLCRAIVHDLEESRSGDFPRPFKHSDVLLKSMLEKASMHAMEQVAEALLGRISDLNPEPAEMVCEWQTSKDGSEEGLILEFADFLAVLSFMHEELGAGGNKSIENHVRDMGSYFEKFADHRFDFIRPLVHQAEFIMLEIFPRKRRS